MTENEFISYIEKLGIDCNDEKLNKLKKYYEMLGSFTTPIDLYYDGRLIRKKSFDYSYALSTHRSQGSSYNNVLVDIRNINTCKDEQVKRQLQYVALSRTRNNVLLYE